MTPPLPITERTETSSVLSEMLARILRQQDETREQLTEVTTRLDELLGRAVPPLSTASSTTNIADAATRYEEYQESTARLLEVAKEKIPAGAKVLVISKGDDALLKIDGRPAQHFPQTVDGRYAGFHPADSADALARLDALIAKGAEFLVIPAASLWWLDHYQEFADHLAGAVIFRDDAIGAICALSEKRASAARPSIEASADYFYKQLRAVVCHLLPAKARLLVISKGDPELVAFDGLDAAHFPQDASGSYAGYHPLDSTAAIEHLEDLRTAGAEYLLIPQSSAWWLDYFPDFRRHLETHARLICHQRNLGVLYSLSHGQA